MDESRFIKNTIYIIAPLERVWDVLINPEQTKKYMFGCETISALQFSWDESMARLFGHVYRAASMRAAVRVRALSVVGASAFAEA